MKPRIILITFSVLILLSCKDKNVQTAHVETKISQSAETMPDDKVDSIRTQFDSTEKSTAIENGRSPASISPPSSEGSLVFFCPQKMTEKTANNIAVLISRSNLEEAVTRLVGEMENTLSTSDSQTVSTNTQSRKIKIFRKMKVELKFSDEDFYLFTKPEHEYEIFDNVKEHQWDWVIQPKKTGNFQLVLIVSGFNEENNNWYPVESPYVFNINVKVDPRNYFSRLWDFLESHPEWILVQVFFPVITFFVGKKRGKKSRK